MQDIADSSKSFQDLGRKMTVRDYKYGKCCFNSLITASGKRELGQSLWSCRKLRVSWEKTGQMCLVLQSGTGGTLKGLPFQISALRAIWRLNLSLSVPQVEGTTGGSSAKQARCRRSH